MGIEKIEAVCKSVLEISKEDFEEMKQVVEEQKTYTHPLKKATVKWQHELGEYNEKALNKLEELQVVLKSGANIRKP